MQEEEIRSLVRLGYLIPLKVNVKKMNCLMLLMLVDARN
jgi:hypothetical protein